MNNFYRKEFQYNGQNIIIETQQVANQTERAFVVRWNNTVVLVTLAIGKEKSESNFLPLTVDFKENLYSAGKIPGGFFKREGKPSEYAVLSSRIIDRSIRNFFPKNFRNEIQILINPLAVDYSLDIRVVVLLATSLVLNTSSLPFHQHIAAISVGLIDDEVVFNPNSEQANESDLNLFIVGTEDKISMIELNAKQVSDEKLVQLLELAQQEIKELISIQRAVYEEIDRKVNEYNLFASNPVIKENIEKNWNEAIEKLISIQSNDERKTVTQKLIKTIIEKSKIVFNQSNPDNLEWSVWENQINYQIEDIFKTKMRNFIIKNEKRLDGRKLNEVRSIECSIDYLPMVHGSAVFTRGITQTISIVTLGAVSEQQIIDNLTKEENKFFMHHYNSAPFAFGGVSPMRGVSRREIGHGVLGEKALKQIMPDQNDFPYTVRVVSEVTQSNGSTSQSAICSSILALLAAGVPIKTNIAGIAMGLIKNNDNYHILTDIQAIEDFYGDMDFKVAGTEKGICTIQLDLKIDGLPVPIIAEILAKAKLGYTQILQTMNAVISKPREELSENALKFWKLKIDVENISSLIGPSGKNIKKIIADCDNCDINIKDTGDILVYHKNQKMIDKAVSTIENCFRKVIINETYTGKISKIMNFGAFVQLNGRMEQGLIHISKISKSFVKDINSIVKVGDKVLVKVIEINQRQQINLELIKKIEDE